MKLNKGEWSELIAGLLALKEGAIQLYNSEIKIFPTSISYDGLKFFSKKDIQTIDLEKIYEILNLNKGAFSLPPAFLDSIGFVKGGSKSKVDLVMNYVLNRQNLNGSFGVKSLIAGKPSLLNASKATNFRFSVGNVTRSVRSFKAKDLLERIDRSNIKFEHCLNQVFLENLKMIDSSLDTILAEILITYFQRGGSQIPELVENSFSQLNKQLQVKKRIKDFLYYVCVGMFPALPWNGKEQIVETLLLSKVSELFCLHRIEIDTFKEYLYLNSFLDTASTTRHNFGSLFTIEDENFLDLNILIRLK
jgi:DNA (cytosine-5)-methyltransferase 1